MEPQVFGRYRITGELGRGAMGSVYRAMDPLIEREVAVKTLLPNAPENDLLDVRGRFLREAKSAGRLNHPNIVTIFDVGEQDGIAYIAMEVLDGRSLQEILGEPKRLPYATIADIVAQVADGLDHAHRLGIVHRDVKPANIVVGADGRAKLTDFGVAYMPMSSLTQTGTALGSPRYMSPEQVTGQPIDPRSDIFSLGVVLYEMLVGATPFAPPGENSVFSVMNRIAGEAHRRITEIDARIPAAFDRILDRALAKSPEERYPRAADMANELRQFLETSAAAATADRAVVLRRSTLPPKAAPAAPAAPRSRPNSLSHDPDRTDRNLLAEFENFANSLEERERVRLEAEEEARLQREEALQRWADDEVRKREAFERQREAGNSGLVATSGGRSGALELLHKRAQSRVTVDQRAKRAEIAARIDKRLREAFRYLAKFTAELNATEPLSERSHGLLFLGEVKRVTLSNASTDYRLRKIESREVFDYVIFRYKAQPPRGTRVQVTGGELPRVRDRLSSLDIGCDCAEQRDEHGRIVRATLSNFWPFPSQAVLRGDYDGAGFVLELGNVRRHGAFQVRLGLDQLSDRLFEEFTLFVLGADDSFARLLPRC
jgi:serine/threonine protein kinase